MPIKIEMPRLSDTMQAGTVVKWNVKEGQKIKTGDALADIETDKATMELQSFDDGTVAVIPVPEGQNVPIGTVILVLAGANEDVASVKSQFAASGSSAAAAPAPKAAAASDAPSAAPTDGTTSGGSVAVLDVPANGAHTAGGHANNGGRIFASPLAKKIAAESNVDLGTLQGSGPAGRIIRKDVEAAISSGTTRAPGRGGQGAGVRDLATRVGTPAPEVRAPKPASLAPNLPAVLPSVGATLTPRTIQLSNMRKTIAKRLVESKTTIPHYQVSVEVDMDALVALRIQLNEQLGAQGVKLSVNDFLVRAVALAMHQHPYVNAKWVSGGTPGNETIEFLGEVNVGVAISLPVAEDGSGGGLVVATLRSADVLGLRQISAETKRLADKARSKGLSVEDMSDSTFTISNLGMFGVDNFTAIINPPNVAILAAGGAIQKPVVRNNQVVPGYVMNMTMSSDHRVIDGAMAAQYLATVKSLLEKPATLLV